MTFFEYLAVIGGTLATVGLLVQGLASTKAAVLLGMREDAPWWFSPWGGRTRGLVLAYLGLLVGLAGGAGTATRAFLPDSIALPWALTWVSFVALLATTMTRAARFAISLATDGRGLLDDPLPEDLVPAVVGADDPELLAARDDALEGRWEPAAHLLAATGDAEMRQMRVELLAEVTGRRRRWLDRWLEAAPRDRDALAVAAAAAPQRVTEIVSDPSPADAHRLAEALEDAEAAARLAAEVRPDDPSPWVTLASLAEIQDVEREKFEARLAAALERAPACGRPTTLPSATGCIRPQTVWATCWRTRSRPRRSLSPTASRRCCRRACTSSSSSTTSVVLRPTCRASPRGVVAGGLREVSRGPLARLPRLEHNLLAFCGWPAELTAAHLAHTRDKLHPWPWATRVTCMPAPAPGRGATYANPRPSTCRAG